MAREMSIGELARRTGVTASTLRYYESLGILEAPPRRGGKRRYPAASVERVEAVKTARDLGFSLEETRVLVQALARGHGTIEDWGPMARRKIDELDARIAAAQRMKRYLQASVDCAARTPSECDCPAYPLIALGLGQGE